MLPYVYGYILYKFWDFWIIDEYEQDKIKNINFVITL